MISFFFPLIISLQLLSKSPNTSSKPLMELPCNQINQDPYELSFAVSPPPSLGTSLMTPHP